MHVEAENIGEFHNEENFYTMYYITIHCPFPGIL